MPGYEDCTLKGLSPKVRSVGERLARLQALRDRTSQDLREKTAEVKTLSQEVLLLTKVEELFRALMDAMVVDQVHSIEAMVSQGLQAIFYDQALKFEAEVRPKYSKVSIDFFIRQGSEDSLVPIRGNPLESFGGGPTSVASLLLRVLTILKLKRRPLLLLDETLAAVSDGYIDTTGKFLQKLASELRIPVLMITHKAAYLDHADLAYQGKEVLVGEARHLQVKPLKKKAPQHEDTTRD